MEKIEIKNPLPKHKIDFLEKNDWELRYLSDGMQKWGLLTDYNYYHLYIYTDSNRCNLYYGAEDKDPETFSARNMISELTKRGF